LIPQPTELGFERFGAWFPTAACQTTTFLLDFTLDRKTSATVFFYLEARFINGLNKAASLNAKQAKEESLVSWRPWSDFVPWRHVRRQNSYGTSQLGRKK